MDVSTSTFRALGTEWAGLEIAHEIVGRLEVILGKKFKVALFLRFLFTALGDRVSMVSSLGLSDTFKLSSISLTFLQVRFC